MPESLTDDTVRHVARLARLALPDEDVARCRGQLADVVRYIEMLEQLDVTDVEPQAHPLSIVNRLAADEPGETMALDALLRNAPASRDRFLDVPKVLGGGGES